MRVLGIECSSKMLSLGAVKDDKVIFAYRRKAHRGASSALIHCQRLLRDNSLKINDFDCFVVGAGPGSFTGLRIAFSIVKGWSCAFSLPVIPVESFFSVAEKVKTRSQRIAVVADARRGLVYASSFTVKGGEVKRETKERLCPLEEFLPLCRDHLVVTYDRSLREKISGEHPRISLYPKDVWPDVMPLLIRGSRIYKQGKAKSLTRLEPLYMYPRTCQVRNG